VADSSSKREQQSQLKNNFTGEVFYLVSLLVNPLPASMENNMVSSK